MYIVHAIARRFRKNCHVHVLFTNIKKGLWSMAGKDLNLKIKFQSPIKFNWVCYAGKCIFKTVLNGECVTVWYIRWAFLDYLDYEYLGMEIWGLIGWIKIKMEKGHFIWGGGGWW